MTNYTEYDDGMIEKDGYPIDLNIYHQDYKDYVLWLEAGNVPIYKLASDYLDSLNIDKQALRDAYFTMITRLEQIQNASSIPFTQTGFNQVIQAVKDEALYIERIMRVLARLL